MLRPGDDRAGGLSAVHMDDVASSPFLGHDPHSPVVPPVGHTFVDGWINGNSNLLSKVVSDQDSAQGQLSSIARMPSQ